MNEDYEFKYRLAAFPKETIREIVREEFTKLNLKTVAIGEIRKGKPLPMDEEDFLEEQTVSPKDVGPESITVTKEQVETAWKKPQQSRFTTDFFEEFCKELGFKD